MKISLLTALFILVFPIYASAGEVTLAWNPNSESDLAGYKIYYDKTTGIPYSNVVDVGNQTSYTVINLDEETDYYFVATAYDLSGNESGYSEEAVYTYIDITPPGTPTNFRVVP